MAKRKKELFEILSRDRTGESAPEPRTPRAESPPKPKPEKRRSRAAAAPESEGEPAERRKPRRRGFGGRKVPVSLNILLLFVGAFVVTNVCSYIVGKGMAGETEVPLATEMRQFYAAKVTHPIPARHSFSVWELRDSLHDAGFEQTEVLGLDNGKYLQIVAGRFDRNRRDECAKLVERVTDHFGLNPPEKNEVNGFVIPIDVRTITISYNPYKPTNP